jgi:hypothetical protein
VASEIALRFLVSIRIYPPDRTPIRRRMRLDMFLAIVPVRRFEEG